MDSHPHDARLDEGLERPIERVTDELPLVEALLPLDGARILELGCGRGEKTRAIAAAGRGRELLALEVDQAQHALNLAADAPPNVRFALGGAERIPAGSGSFDVVLLFKSLHHVPLERLDDALAEVARVLRPGGLACVSEPLFRGAFNDVLRLFHDERLARRAAFEAVERSVRAGALELVSQTFFLAPLHFEGFADFERQVIGVTHTRHELTPELHARVRARFAESEGPDGARFLQPVRLDLLRKPDASSGRAG